MKKGWAQLLVPDVLVPSVMAIDPLLLARHDLLIVDLDNTLVFPETLESPEPVARWFQKVSRSRRVVCVSNSPSVRQRSADVQRLFGCALVVGRGKKPSARLFREIQDAYRVPSERIAVIGDRLLTDVVFGNQGGATTILVQPLSPRESLLIRVVRVLERFLLKFQAGESSGKNS